MDFFKLSRRTAVFHCAITYHSYNVNETLQISSYQPLIKILRHVQITKFLTHVARTFCLRACYITGQWGEFKVKNAAWYLHIHFRHCFVVFNQKICLFLSFLFLFFDEASSLRNRTLTKLHSYARAKWGILGHK